MAGRGLQALGLHTQAGGGKGCKIGVLPSSLQSPSWLYHHPGEIAVCSWSLRWPYHLSKQLSSDTGPAVLGQLLILQSWSSFPSRPKG
jgi:hypothetical protein